MSYGSAAARRASTGERSDAAADTTGFGAELNPDVSLVRPIAN
jgi:hypothetical protein